MQYLLLLFFIIILLIIIIFYNYNVNNTKSIDIIDKSTYDPRTRFIIDYLRILYETYTSLRSDLGGSVNFELMNLIKNNIDNIINGIEANPVDYDLIFLNITNSIINIFNLFRYIISMNNRNYNKNYICYYFRNLYEIFIKGYGDSLMMNDIESLKYFIQKLEYNIYYDNNNDVLINNLNIFLSFIKDKIK